MLSNKSFYQVVSAAIGFAVISSFSFAWWIEMVDGIAWANCCILGLILMIVVPILVHHISEE